MEAIGLVIERLEAAWLPAQLVPDPQFHAYEPLRVDQWLDALRVAMAIAPGERYLEVGCGIGTKLVIAAAMGLNAHGIEHRENYVAIARFLLDQPPQNFTIPTVEIADARFWDGYRGFDIVYSYRPIVAEAGQTVFEAMLTDKMRSGSVLISPCRPGLPGWSATDHSWVWVR